MMKKLALMVVALLTPALACAGLVNVYVVSGSGSGSASKGGYYATAKFVNFSGNTANGYTQIAVTRNRVAVTPTPVGTTHWQYLVPLSSATQTVQATFSQPAAAKVAVLAASCPSSTNVNAGTAGNTFAGQTSMVKNAVAPTFTFSAPAGITFTPATGSATDPNTIKTVITATTPGTYTGTLTIAATNGTPSSKTFTINVVGTGVTASNACLSCHAGWTEATVYAGSAHAQNAVACQNCHAGTHPGLAVTSATCESCHSSKLSKTTHPVAITASKCLVCHDSHNPAAGIANLGQAPAHPAVTLYTFEELGMQMAGGAKVPVQVDANGKGMPYSPKQTCGTAGCHVKNGVDYTYDKISDHAFHSGQGRSEFVDSSNGKLDATKNKPWYQSTAMVGKW
jgi:hypothetical protein